jgi:peptide/nickel transport system substrate-binding protein
VASPPFTNQTCFDSLVSVSVDRRWIPALASSFKIAPDWKYIDFNLRTDVKFHNGDPVTAEDVKFSLGVYMDPKYKFQFGPMWRRTVGEVEIVRPDLVRIHMKAADYGFIGRMWWGAGVMPKKYRQEVGDEEFAKHPIGAGPFRFADYKQDQWAIYEAVPNHYRKTPSVKTIKLLYVGDNMTRLAMFKNGEADMGPMHSTHIKEVQADPKLRLFWVKYVSGTNMYFCDMVDADTPSPFKDIRVRKAVSLAIDRETICKRILFGASEPWGDVLPPITLGYDPTLKPDPYDPEQAKALLKEAGYPNGFETTMNVSTTNTTAEALTASLEEIGIKAKIEKYEAGAFYGGVFGKKFRGLLPYAGWYDPEVQAPAELSDFYLKGTPHAYYTTDEVDAALRKGMYATTDEELTEWGRKISKLIRENYVTVFLWANHQPHCLGPRIKSWEPSVGCLPAIAFETIELK